ncbi:MAG: hypothetical protein AABY89_12835, partial [Acidobacteriota bacterium]
MANRVGIELLPSACRVIEIQDQAGFSWFRRKSRTRDTRVTAFAELPYSPGASGALAAELSQVLGGRLSGRRVWVAPWGLHSTHQVMLLPGAGAHDVEAMARREAKQAPRPAGGAGELADGVVVGDLREHGRTDVVYVSVPADEIRSRIQPLLDAGLTLEGVVTPALAHAALVRQRSASFPDAVTAVLSVNAHATAITVLRGGLVLFAREMPWGFETERSEQPGHVLDVGVFAARLASELRRSLVHLKQSQKADVGHVLVCGDVPDLRALTAPLMHELDIEVETLDSLEGFDMAHLPEPADQFRSRVGSLRTAWALAADQSPPVNLLPREVTPVRIRNLAPPNTRRLAAAAVVGVILAAALWGVGELMARSSKSEADALRRQVATLEPQSRRADEVRRVVALVTAREAALRAWDSQGRRLTRVLDAIARSAPVDVAVTTFKIEPRVGAWHLTVEGHAEGENPAAAQVAFNKFLRQLRDSSLLGEPSGPPSLKIRTGEPAPPPPVNTAVAQRATQQAYLRPIEQPRQVRAGPAYLEVARDGRLYRIPL